MEMIRHMDRVLTVKDGRVVPRELSNRSNNPN
jgi:hypothetical protein